MTTRVRKNILDLSDDELDTLITAWIGIQSLKPSDENSFYAIAGLHGQPFRGAGWGNANWWGGYCNHGNVLFPTWHRAYVLRLEEALRTIDGCGDVALPYWDELSDSLDGTVIPWIFLTKEYTFQSNQTVKNPLYSYKFQRGFTDQVGRPGEDYSKPKFYETVRYPYSGLVGDQDQQNTARHNRRIDAMGADAVTSSLEEQVSWWLKMGPRDSSMRSRYKACLEVEDYTVFSNWSSATKWNDDHQGERNFKPAVPIESPHDGIHLAVGGYSIPGGPALDLIAGANGDMGENDTAAFDPIFWFHHCFIDKMLWDWQVKHNSTENLELWDKYPGTNSVDSQGPTPGVAAGAYLTLDTTLDPFGCTSQDVANITNLGYSYADSFGEAMQVVLGRERWPGEGLRMPKTQADSRHYLRVSGINRGAISGSFVITVWASEPDSDDDPELVGFEPVFSRWHVTGCANCNNHLGVTVFMPLDPSWEKEKVKRMDYTTVVHTSRSGESHPIWGPGKKMGLAEPIIRRHNI